MAQLRRGARQTLELLHDDLNDIERLAHDNPAAVLLLVYKVRRRMKDEIEPFLERANPPLEDRIKQIEERLTRAGIA